MIAITTSSSIEREGAVGGTGRSLVWMLDMR